MFHFLKGSYVYIYYLTRAYTSIESLNYYDYAYLVMEAVRYLCCMLEL